MIRYISKKPMIAIVPHEAQKDRIDTFFYHHIFADLDEKLDQAGDDLVPAEKASLLITDGTHQTPTYTEHSSGVLFLSSTNITEHGLDLADCKHITKELHDRLKNCQPRPGDVLIAKSGTVGTACVFPEGIQECSVYESVAIFRPNKKWLPQYIVSLINSDLGIRQIQRSQKGIAIKHLHLGDLKELWFPRITEEEQAKLVVRLNSVARLHKTLTDRCISLRKKEHGIAQVKVDLAFANELQIPKFAELRGQLVFLRNSALAERLDVPANHPDYTQLVDQIKNSPVAGSISDLVDVSEEQFNLDDNAGEDANYLAIGDIDGISGKIIAPQTMLADELPSRARRLIHEGNILVGIAGASTGTENMVVFLVSTEQHGWVATTGFLVLRPKEGVDVHYVCKLIKAPFILRQIRALLTSPSMPTISESDFLAMSVPLTNDEIRKDTLTRINAILAEEQQLTEKLDAISEQIEKLLAQAKSNIFDLLDDAKFATMSAKSEGINSTMAQIGQELQ